MNCQHCGQPLADGAQFCGSCGQPTQPAQPTQPVEAANAAAPVPESFSASPPPSSPAPPAPAAPVSNEDQTFVPASPPPSPAASPLAAAPAGTYQAPAGGQPQPAGPAPAIPGQPNPLQGQTSDKSYLTTFLLAYFLGIFGVDRFYTGETGLGVLKLLTLGGCGIWALIDTILVLAGVRKDKFGRELYGRQKDFKTSLIIFLIFTALSTLGSLFDAIGSIFTSSN